ncbi:hypothetical protein G8O24_15105 [Bradyrhizobium sp. INPA01-394B]|uniref:Secreted protein n=1 Tax=Bradyrhizobium campsiandrae TaxID=1729892 RepID=A0ABR7UI80_9BRAD|nr:hypothetical protein [Bradyrhizobium campsiandrae]MBC9878668.1 hypothetical protein [Bradyrhizobium campsiandrae]MBC9983311.1 hypothetical protein [Bradyrhizobium campsiandrae]
MIIQLQLMVITLKCQAFSVLLLLCNTKEKIRFCTDRHIQQTHARLARCGVLSQDVHPNDVSVIVVVLAGDAAALDPDSGEGARTTQSVSAKAPSD